MSLALSPTARMAKFQAKVVLLADGVNSPLAAKTGFRPEMKPEHVALAVKETIELAPEIIEQRFGFLAAMVSPLKFWVK